MCGAPGGCEAGGRGRVRVCSTVGRVIRADSRTDYMEVVLPTPHAWTPTPPPVNSDHRPGVITAVMAISWRARVQGPPLRCAWREAPTAEALALNSLGRVTRPDGMVQPASHPSRCAVPGKRLSFWQPCAASPRTASSFPMISGGSHGANQTTWWCCHVRFWMRDLGFARARLLAI